MELAQQQPGSTQPASVVIVGGGFAGLRCAMELAPHRQLRVTLVDQHNYQQFQPLLYQVAASLLSSSNAAFALRDVLGSYSNVDVQMDEVTSVDLAGKTWRMVWTTRASLCRNLRPWRSKRAGTVLRIFWRCYEAKSLPPSGTPIAAFSP